LCRLQHWRPWCQSPCGSTQDKQDTHHVGSQRYVSVVMLDRSRGGIHLCRQWHWRGWGQSHCGRTQDKQRTHQVESPLYTPFPIVYVLLTSSPVNGIDDSTMKSIVDQVESNKKAAHSRLPSALMPSTTSPATPKPSALEKLDNVIAAQLVATKSNEIDQFDESESQNDSNLYFI